MIHQNMSPQKLPSSVPVHVDLQRCSIAKSVMTPLTVIEPEMVVRTTNGAWNVDIVFQIPLVAL